MRLTRAYLAGLGTTGSLLAATACAVVFTSAVLTFRGALGLPSIGPGSGSISISNPASAPFDRPGPKIIAVRATVAAARVVPTRTVLVASAKVTATAPAPAPTPVAALRTPTVIQEHVQVPDRPLAPTRPPNQVVVVTSPTPVSPPPSDGSPPHDRAGQRAAGAQRQITSDLSTTVQRTTRALGDTVSPLISPPVGQALTTAGQQAGGLVNVLGGTVGGVVHSALPGLPR